MKYKKALKAAVYGLSNGKNFAPLPLPHHFMLVRRTPPPPCLALYMRTSFERFLHPTHSFFDFLFFLQIKSPEKAEQIEDDTKT